MPDRGLIYWYRTGWEHRVAELDLSAARLCHRVKFLEPGQAAAPPESIERSTGLIGTLRSTVLEGLEWLAAHPSPEAGVNAAFRGAWESYMEAADALGEMGAGAGIMTADEAADRSRDAWADARRAEHLALEIFSETVAPDRRHGIHGER